MTKLYSIKELEDMNFVKLLRGNGISKSDFVENGVNKCIHYGDLYTLYQGPTIDNILHFTNTEGRVLSVSGDVLVPATTTADAMGIAIARAINEDGVIIGSDINVVRTKNDKILATYLSYMINFPLKPKLASYAKGTNILHLTNNDIRNLCFPVPDISEQQRIVKKLDALFIDIEKEKQVVQQNLQNAKELFESEKKSLMQKVQHYENVHLVDLYNFIDYRGVTPNKIDTGVPLVTAKNVKMGYIDYTIKDFISEEDYLARQSRGISKKGDILFTTEAPLGNVAIADLDKFSAGQRIITLQQYSDGKLELSNDFYCYYMQSDYFQTIIHSLASGATAQGIKAAKLKLVLVPLVPYQIQKEIVEKLDALHEQTQKLEQIYTQQIADLDELKQAILKKAFNGEL